MGKSQQKWSRKRYLISKVRENDERGKHPCLCQAGWVCVEFIPGVGCKWKSYRNRVCLNWLNNECTKPICLFEHRLHCEKKMRIRKRKKKKFKKTEFSVSKGEIETLPRHRYSVPATSLVVESGIKKPVVTLNYAMDLNSWSTISPIDIAASGIQLSEEALKLRTGDQENGLTIMNSSTTPVSKHIRYTNPITEHSSFLSVTSSSSGSWSPTPSTESAILFSWIFLNNDITPNSIIYCKQNPAAKRLLSEHRVKKGWEYEAMLNLEITICLWREIDLLEMSRKSIPFRYQSTEGLDSRFGLSSRYTPAVYVRSFVESVAKKLFSHWFGSHKQTQHNISIIMKAVDALLHGGSTDLIPTSVFISQLHTSKLSWIQKENFHSENESQNQAVRNRLIGRFFHFTIAHVLVPVIREYFPAQREDGHSILHYHIFLYRKLWKLLLSTTPGYTAVPVPLQVSIKDFTSEIECCEEIQKQGINPNIKIKKMFSSLQRILNDGSLDGYLQSMIKAIIEKLSLYGVRGILENNYGITSIIRGVLQCSEEYAGNFIIEEGHIVEIAMSDVKIKKKKKYGKKLLNESAPFQLRVKKSGGPRWARIIWKCGISPYSIRYSDNLKWQHKVQQLKHQHVVLRTTLGKGPEYSLHRLKPWLVRHIDRYRFDKPQRRSKTVCYKQFESGTATLEVRPSPNTEITNLLLRSYSGIVVRDDVPILAALQLLKKAQKVIAPSGFYLAHLDASQAYDAISHDACIDAVSELSTPSTKSDYLRLLLSITEGRQSGIPQGWVLAEYICNIIQRDRVAPTAAFYTKDEYPPFIAHMADDILIITFSLVCKFFFFLLFLDRISATLSILKKKKKNHNLQESLNQITAMLSRPDMLHGVIPNFLKSEMATPSLSGSTVTFAGRCISPSLEVYPSLKKYCKAPMWKRVSVFQSYSNKNSLNDDIAADVRSGFVSEKTLLASVEDHRMRKVHQAESIAPIMSRLSTYPLSFVKGHLSEWYFDVRLNGIIRRKKTLLCACIVGWMSFYALMGKGIYRPLTSIAAVSTAAERFKTRLKALVSARVSRGTVRSECCFYLISAAGLLVSSHALSSLHPSDSFYPLALSLHHHNTTTVSSVAVFSHIKTCQSCSAAVKKRTWDLLLRSGMEAWVVPEGGFRDSLPSGRLLHLLKDEIDESESDCTEDIV